MCAFFYSVKNLGTVKCRQERAIEKYDTFPSQALSCSGSTGIISAFRNFLESTPGRNHPVS
jgi:hypothetical protein